MSADLLETARAERIEPVVSDVTDPGQVASLARHIAGRYGRLDILIANAGRPFASSSLESGEAEWAECLDLNLKSAWYCAREMHPLLAESGRGSIVMVASIQGLLAGRRTFPYSAAKAGLLGLTKSLAIEYAPAVRVNAVVPAQVESVRTGPYFDGFPDPELARRRTIEAYPMKRLGQPEDVAAAIAFLASDEAAWITGTFLTVDGGISAAQPGLS